MNKTKSLFDCWKKMENKMEKEIIKNHTTHCPLEKEIVCAGCKKVVKDCRCSCPEVMVMVMEKEFKLKCMRKDNVEYWIGKCEGKHIQQVVYSTYHKALTQICFGCKKIRTSLKEEDLK